MTVGIYVIRNNINNKAYIGQSVSIETRKNSHVSELRNNKHRNDYLQKAFNKYGEESFSHETIIECGVEELDSIEKLMISIFNTTNDRFGYNLDSGGNSNRIKSEYTRKKMSKALKGRKMTPEQIEKMSKARKGIKLSKETRKRMSITRKGEGSYWFGKKLDEEHRKKLSEAHKGKVLSDEHRKAISIGNAGKTLSAETRRKLSEINKGKTISEEQKRLISEANKGKELSEKTKEKIKKYQLGRHLGSKNQNARLTEEDVIQIKILLRDSDLNQREIGELFNVGSNTINRIKSGKRWSHIEI